MGSLICASFTLIMSIVFGCMEEEHLEHLHIVFERFCEFSLKLKPSKCSFFQLEIIYLAHHFSWEGIWPSCNNMWVVEEFPMLETFMQVCTFCGLMGHYHRFIKGCAHLVHPLYDVLGKEVKMGQYSCLWRLKRQCESSRKKSNPCWYWCFQTLISHSCSKRMPPRRD